MQCFEAHEKKKDCSIRIPPATLKNLRALVHHFMTGETMPRLDCSYV